MDETEKWCMYVLPPSGAHSLGVKGAFVPPFCLKTNEKGEYTHLQIDNGIRECTTVLENR